MAGSNAVPVKTGLVAVLKAAIAPVQMLDAYNGRLAERECVYVGKILGPQQPMTFREANARLTRQEDLTVDLHVEVMHPAGTTVDSDARAVAIGTLIEHALAADPRGTGANVPGLLAWWVSNYQLTSFYLDDGTAASEGLYTISVLSQLG